MMRARALTLIALAALALAACVTAPETPAQRLAYVDGQFTALVNTAADLREQGVLSEAAVERLDGPIQRGNTALEAAWAALGQGRPDDAVGYLRVVNDALLALRRELEARQ